MTRIRSYILFVAFFFMLTSLLPFDGFISNSISACVSIALLYFVHRKVAILEGALLLLIITVVVPAAILLLVGGSNDAETIDMLAKNINALSSLQFFLPSVLGASILIGITIIVNMISRRKT